MKYRKGSRIHSPVLPFVFVVTMMVLFRGRLRLVGWRYTTEAFVIRQHPRRNFLTLHYHSHHRHINNNNNNAFSSLKYFHARFHARTSGSILNHPRWMSIRGGQSEEVEEPSSRLVTQEQKMQKKVTNEISDDEQVETKGSGTQQRAYERPKSIVDDTQTPDDASTSSSTSSSFFLSSSWRSVVENRFVSSWRRSFRRRAGELFTIGGFLSSATTSLYTHRQGQWKRLQTTVDALVAFLRDSQLDTQLSQSLLNIRVLDNLVLLGRMQQLINQQQSLFERAALEEITDEQARKRRRLDESSGHEESSAKGGGVASASASNDPFIPTVEQAIRYMKFATAAYGNAMIRAAQLDVTGQYDTRMSLFNSDMTLTRVSEHANVPADDIVLLDIDYKGSDQHLRHFVAIDHEHQEIVLSIRGTFSLAEFVVDAAGFCEPFGDGGQAHAEMAKQAQAVWKSARPAIVKVWKAHPEYKLTLTGHSLGAGTACLLHLYLYENALQDIPPGHQIQCVAFAAPPVYANEHPSPSLQSAMRRCVNFIYGHDAVPFLSVDSVRHLLSALQWVEKKTSGIRYRERLQLFWGYGDIDPTWVQELRDLPHLDPLPGAPVLTIPAAVNLWLTPRKNRDGSNDSSEDDDYDPNLYYEWHRCDSSKLATLAGGLQVDLNMLQDHFPPRYEHALHHFHPDAAL
eukprot:scaffold13558_cov177-Amphora_coffeaeformis.AAC.2